MKVSYKRFKGSGLSSPGRKEAFRCMCELVIVLLFDHAGALLIAISVSHAWMYASLSADESIKEAVLRASISHSGLQLWALVRDDLHGKVFPWLIFPEYWTVSRKHNVFCRRSRHNKLLLKVASSSFFGIFIASVQNLHPFEASKLDFHCYTLRNYFWRASCCEQLTDALSFHSKDQTSIYELSTLFNSVDIKSKIISIYFKIRLQNLENYDKMQAYV